MEEQAHKLKPLYIDEDYFERKDVPIEGYAGLTIEYRPVTVKQAARIADRMLADDKIATSTQTNLELIKTNIVSWNITDMHGEIVDHTDMGKLQNLDPFVVRAIINTIRGADSAQDEEDLRKIQDAVKNL